MMIHLTLTILLLVRVSSSRDLTPVPCGAHTNCQSCLNDRNCGWCGYSKQCHEGVSAGPILNVECEKSWNYRTCDVPKCETIKDCQTCVMHESCGWCDFGGEGKCTGGSSLGPSENVKRDAKDSYDRCGVEPEPLNGFNHFWSHHGGLSCPRMIGNATKVEDPEIRTRDLTIGITLVHERENMNAKEENRIQLALSDAVSIPKKRTKIFVSGVTREDSVNGTAGTTYRVDLEFTAIGLNETEAKRVVKDLDRIVSDGTLNNEFFKNNLAFKVHELHTMPLRSTGTRSSSSEQKDFEPLPPLRITLDPLWTEDEPEENVTTSAPVEMIHSLTDHPHTSATKSRFRSSRRSDISSRNQMIKFLRSQFESASSQVDDEQRAILESNFQQLEGCLRDPSQSLEDCGL